jgi:hypothetical protein
MKVTIHVIKHSPNSVEKIELEDVSSYEVMDNKIMVHFNGSPDEIISLVKTEENPMQGEWFGMEVFCTRIGLQIDMSK